MNKTETKAIVTKYLATKIVRRNKTPEYRQSRATYLIGYIQCLRDLSKLCKLGNEKAQIFGELCEFKETQALQVLRKV